MTHYPDPESEIASLQASLLFADSLAKHLPEPKRSSFRRALRHGAAAKEALPPVYDMEEVMEVLRRVQTMGERV